MSFFFYGMRKRSQALFSKCCNSADFYAFFYKRYGEIFRLAVYRITMMLFNLSIILHFTSDNNIVGANYSGKILKSARC